MPEVILSDYFYGNESEQFVFFKIPCQLVTDPKFKHISTDAKLNCTQDCGQWGKWIPRLVNRVKSRDVP